jgi:hypothetical protein
LRKSNLRVPRALFALAFVARAFGRRHGERLLAARLDDLDDGGRDGEQDDDDDDDFQVLTQDRDRKSVV